MANLTTQKWVGHPVLRFSAENEPNHLPRFININRFGRVFIPFFKIKSFCGGFHKWDTPINGLSIMETPDQMDDLGVLPLMETPWNPHIHWFTIHNISGSAIGLEPFPRQIWCRKECVTSTPPYHQRHLPGTWTTWTKGTTSLSASDRLHVAISLPWLSCTCHSLCSKCASTKPVTVPCATGFSAPQQQLR